MLVQNQNRKNIVIFALFLLFSIPTKNLTFSLSDAADWAKDHIAEPIENAVKTVANEISDLASKIASIENQVQHEVSDFQHKMVLEGQKIELQTEQSFKKNLQATLTQVQDNVSKIQSNIETGIKNATKEIQDVQEALKKAVNQASALEGTVQSSFKSMKNELTTLPGKIAELTKEIKTFSENLIGKNDSQKKQQLAEKLVETINGIFQNAVPNSWVLEKNDYFAFLLYNILGCTFDTLKPVFNWKELQADVIEKLSVKVMIPPQIAQQIQSHLNSGNLDQICLDCKNLQSNNTEQPSGKTCTQNCNKTIDTFYCDAINRKIYSAQITKLFASIPKDKNYTISFFNVIATLIPKIYIYFNWDQLNSILSNFKPNFSSDQISAIRSALKSGKAMPHLKVDNSEIRQKLIQTLTTALKDPSNNQYANDSTMSNYLMYQALLSIINSSGPDSIKISDYLTWAQLKSDVIDKIGLQLSSAQETILKKALGTN